VSIAKKLSGPQPRRYQSESLF